MTPHADDHAKGRLLSALLAIALSAFAAQCATIRASETTCEGIRVLSNELTAGEADAYCRYAVAERNKVEAFWGATWRDPIRIHVSSIYTISRALVPGHFGNRGFMEMPLQAVRRNTGALLHEIVHIYAPNTNRFLAEGLAVYLHSKLAGNPGYPNFGEDLRRWALRSLPDLDSLDTLNSVRTPQRLGTGMDEKTAYVVAGSFVGFLIEKYGLKPFRSLYETEHYEKVYGKSLRTLEKEWRSSLQQS